MSRRARGFFISVLLHGAALAAVIAYVPGLVFPDKPDIIKVELVAPAEPVPVAPSVQKTLTEPEARPLADIQAPNLDLPDLPAPDDVDIRPPPRDTPVPDALASVEVPTLNLAAIPAPDTVDVEQPEPSPETLPPPDTQVASLPAPSEPSAQGSDAGASQQAQTLDREEQDLRDHLPDRVGVRRDGPKLSLDVIGDVLFELDSSELRPQARALIGLIAAQLAQQKFGHVAVNGFTDTSGTPEHNRQLSQQRADAVADALANNGIDRARIRSVGLGESQLAIPTARGVKDERNRRVEIVLDPKD